MLTVFSRMRYPAHVKDVRSHHTGLTAVDTMLYGNSDALTEGRKHFLECNSLVKRRPVSLPCFARRSLRILSIIPNRVHVRAPRSSIRSIQVLFALRTPYKHLVYRPHEGVGE